MKWKLIKKTINYVAMYQSYHQVQLILVCVCSVDLLALSKAVQLRNIRVAFIISL